MTYSFLVRLHALWLAAGAPPPHLIYIHQQDAVLAAIAYSRWLSRQPA